MCIIVRLREGRGRAKYRGDVGRELNSVNSDACNLVVSVGDLWSNINRKCPPVLFESEGDDPFYVLWIGEMKFTLLL